MLVSDFQVTFGTVTLHCIILLPAMFMSLRVPMISYSGTGEPYPNRACGVRPVVFDESPHHRLHGRTKRVIGGEGAELGEFPWQVALGTLSTSGRFEPFCGGVLVHAQWILTAAHCIFPEGNITQSITARLGITDDRNLTTYVDAQLSERIVHDGFSLDPWRAQPNDIALLKLAESVPLSAYIFPVCLAPYKNYAGTFGILSGWGDLCRGGPRPHILKETRVPFIDNTECQQWFTPFSGMNITPELICTADRNGGRGACGADSGSPVVQERDGRWVVVGVVNGVHGTGCSWPYFSGRTIFAFVPHFAEWIQTKTNGDVHS